MQDRQIYSKQTDIERGKNKCVDIRKHMETLKKTKYTKRKSSTKEFEKEEEEKRQTTNPLKKKRKKINKRWTIFTSGSYF